MINALDLSFSYENEGAVTKVLEKINIDINKGEFVAVLGRNGSGKSTFAKLMNAILLPSGGKVYVCGTDSSEKDKTLEIRKNVGMVFQNPDNQLVATVVEEDVAFGPENLGIDPEEIRERIDWALGVVEMSEYKNAAPHHLSGGQKQRIAIAGILAMKPKCIVLDEPTAALDALAESKLYSDFDKLIGGKTAVYISHRLSSTQFCKHVAMFRDGRLEEYGTHDELMKRGGAYAEMFRIQAQYYVDDAGKEVPANV